VSLLSALELKLASCTASNDALGIAFWGDRVIEKRKGVQTLQDELVICQDEFANMIGELDTKVGTDLSLREHAEGEEREEVVRTQRTHDELAAWYAGNDIEPDSAFPPLDEVLHNRAQGGFGRHGHHHRRRFGPYPNMPSPPNGWDHPHHRRHHEGFRHFIDRVSDVVNNPSAASSLVPTQEIKSMLDTFLVNLSNQLAGTFEGAPKVASNDNIAEPERPIPGAFVQTQAAGTQTQSQTPTPPAAEKEKVIKPCTGLGKGGFRHKHISCDGCLMGIRGMRYKCQVSHQYIH
jgi:next-to-BRCA1 protein 1